MTADACCLYRLVEAITADNIEQLIDALKVSQFERRSSQSGRLL